VRQNRLKAGHQTVGIQVPGGKYSVIVVPPCKLMPLETFQKLLSLAENGATVIFEKQLPSDVSGENDLAKQRSEFKKLISRLSFRWHETRAGNVEEAKVGQGSVFRRDLTATYSLGNANMEVMPQFGLSFVRRSFDGGWHYFIVNRSGTNFDGLVTLGRAAKSVVILDPMTSNSGVAASRQSAANSTEVYLQLAAGESVILRAFADKKVEGAAWTYWQPQTPDAKTQTLTGPWKVKFIAGGPVIPSPFSTTNLASWTELGDTNAESFAGSALYTITFDAPGLESRLQAVSGNGGTLKREHQTYFLDLGDVRQSARIRLNGRDYGTLIMPPFRVVVDNLKSKGNMLEIEVTSVSANRIRDLDRRGVPWKKFHDINFVNLNYRPFDASDWPLTDSGLLGPVTLAAVVPAQIK
jgi:hypothetical protein